MGVWLEAVGCFLCSWCQYHMHGCSRSRSAEMRSDSVLTVTMITILRRGLHEVLAPGDLSHSGIYAVDEKWHTSSDWCVSPMHFWNSGSKAASVPSPSHRFFSLWQSLSPRTHAWVMGQESTGVCFATVGVQHAMPSCGIDLRTFHGTRAPAGELIIYPVCCHLYHQLQNCDRKRIAFRRNALMYVLAPFRYYK